MGPIGFYSYNFLTYRSLWNHVQRDPVAVEVRAVDLPHKVVGAHVGQDDGLHTGDPLLDVLNPAKKNILSQVS